MQFLKETTKYDVDYNVPMHTYAYDKGKCVGYIPEGSTELRMFSKPMTQFSKSRRTFKEVKI